MRNYTIIFLTIFYLPLCLTAQSVQKGVYADKKFTKYTEGGDFAIKCNASKAIDFYKKYMKGYDTKKRSNTEYTTIGQGGTVNVTIENKDEITSVSIQVNDAGFKNLTFELHKFMQAELLRDTFVIQKNVLNGLIDRQAKLKRQNISLSEDIVSYYKAIERLKKKIADAEDRINLNTGYVQTYDISIETQQGLLNDIDNSIKEILAMRPEK